MLRVLFILEPEAAEPVIASPRLASRTRAASSAFEGTGLARRLREAGVRRLWVRPVDARSGDGDRALEEMAAAGEETVERRRAA